MFIKILYNQLSPCGHPVITDTPMIRTAAKSHAKLIYSCLSEINCRYYGHSLMRTPAQGPYSLRCKESLLYWEVVPRPRPRTQGPLPLFPRGAPLEGGCHSP